MSSPDFLAPSRSHVMLLDRGLNGGYGATRIMAHVSSSTTHIVVNHNRLGDQGARMLFHRMRLEKDVRVEDVEMNSCQIGDAGMRALAGWLTGNTSLERLYLNGNEFTGDEATVAQFVDAVNHSHLRHLSLSTNTLLSDHFLQHFLPNLTSPHLRSLHMNLIGLTSTSVPLITAFLTSPQGKRLDQLTLNGDSLGYAGVQTIIACVERHITGLQALEMDANAVEGEVEDPESAKRWAMKLKRVILRNAMLRARVRAAAVNTLCYGRTLLHAEPSPSASSPLMTLPTELHLLILRQFADRLQILSDAQFARVVQYASTWEQDALLLPAGKRGLVAWQERVGCVYYEREPGKREVVGLPDKVELVGY